MPEKTLFICKKNTHYLQFPRSTVLKLSVPCLAVEIVFLLWRFQVWKNPSKYIDFFHGDTEQERTEMSRRWCRQMCKKGTWVDQIFINAVAEAHDVSCTFVSWSMKRDKIDSPWLDWKQLTHKYLSIYLYIYTYMYIYIFIYLYIYRCTTVVMEKK